MIFVSCNFCLDCKQMNKTCKGITNMHKSSQLPTTQSPLARAERESQKPGSGGRWSIPPASSDCSRDANFSVKVSIRRRNFDSLPRGHSEWRVHTPQKGGGHPPSQQIFLDILLWCFVLLFCCAKWRSFLLISNSTRACDAFEGWAPSNRWFVSGMSGTLPLSTVPLSRAWRFASGAVFIS